MATYTITKRDYNLETVEAGWYKIGGEFFNFYPASSDGSLEDIVLSIATNNVFSIRKG